MTSHRCEHSREKPNTWDFDRHCGAWICVHCGEHRGLARCFCGWSKTSPGNGRAELIEDGETIEPEEP